MSPNLFNSYRYASGGEWSWEDDFTSDLGWARVRTDVTYDFTTNNRANYAFQRDGYCDNGTFDVQQSTALNGSNMSDTAWVFRWDHEQTSQNVSGGMHSFWGCINTTDCSIMGSTGNYAIGIFQALGVNSQMCNANNQGLESNLQAAGGDWGATWHWYLQYIRTSATGCSLERYSDAAYSSLNDSFTNTQSSSIVDLRYLSWQKAGYPSDSATVNGQWTNIFFADDVTTPP
jgi:hypothetical protein